MCARRWDRQPYLTHSGHRDGYPDSDKHGTSGASILKEHDLITKNFFINGCQCCPSFSSFRSGDRFVLRKLRCVRIKFVIWKPCMTDIDLQFERAQYGLYYPNAPVEKGSQLLSDCYTAAFPIPNAYISYIVPKLLQTTASGPSITTTVASTSTIRRT